MGMASAPTAAAAARRAAAFTAPVYSAHMVVDPEFRIAGVNPEFEAATHRTSHSLVGVDAFVAFPAAPGGGWVGPARQRESFERVFQRGRADRLWALRYDVPTPDGDAFVRKVWNIVNTPVVDGGGTVVGVRKQAQDITAHEELVGDLAAAVESAEDADSLAIDSDTLARVVSVMPGIALSRRDALHENAHLRRALETRASIEQAKGILMTRHTCGPDEAFARLVDLSQHTNRKLADVAHDLVAEVAPQHPRP
ncbi:ANTAR domain-containing protein [Rhodococcus rhodnii]|nr:ANTAR domain-containing protein [Rhodococcus rhodnii]